MNITQAIYNQPDSIGIVRFADLREFALELMAAAERKTEERLRRETAANTADEVRLTRAEVMNTYHISASTLTRWSRDGYLRPDGYIGSKPYYYAKNVERVVKGQQREQGEESKDE